MIDLLLRAGQPHKLRRDNEIGNRRGRELLASSLGRLVAAQIYSSQAVVQLVKALHLRRRRGTPVDVIAHEATPLIVANDFHEVSMLALHVSAAIQALDIMKNLVPAMRLQVDRRPNPDTA